MSETVSIRKSAFLIICGAAIVVLAILLIMIFRTGGQARALENDKSSNGTLIQDKARLPIERKLADFIKKGDYHSIFLVSNAGRVKWVGAEDGGEVRICGQATDETKDLRAVCDLKKISIERITQITLMQITKNPDCMLGNVDGALAVVHSTKNPDGKWKKGQWDCHDASASKHNS